VRAHAYRAIVFSSSQWRIREFLSGGQFCSQNILRGGQRWAIVAITKKSVGNCLFGHPLDTPLGCTGKFFMDIKLCMDILADSYLGDSLSKISETL
jgi:hypothetical protein